MAVIDTSWSLTGNDDYDCMRCDFNKEASTNGKRYCGKTGLMLPNNRKGCPLRSADEILEKLDKIEELYNLWNTHHLYDSTFVDEVREVLHGNCCDKEENNENRT